MTDSEYQRIKNHRGNVRVRRSSGALEDSWVLARTDTAPYGVVYVALPNDGPERDWPCKRVPIERFLELNPELSDGGARDRPDPTGRAQSRR